MYYSLEAVPEEDVEALAKAFLEHNEDEQTALKAAVRELLFLTSSTSSGMLRLGPPPVVEEK